MLALLRSGARAGARSRSSCPSLERWRAPLETVLRQPWHPVRDRRRACVSARRRSGTRCSQFLRYRVARTPAGASCSRSCARRTRASAAQPSTTSRAACAGARSTRPERVEEEAEKLREAPLPGLAELRAADHRRSLRCARSCARCSLRVRHRGSACRRDVASRPARVRRRAARARRARRAGALSAARSGARTWSPRSSAPRCGSARRPKSGASPCSTCCARARALRRRLRARARGGVAAAPRAHLAVPRRRPPPRARRRGSSAPIRSAATATSSTPPARARRRRLYLVREAATDDGAPARAEPVLGGGRRRLRARRRCARDARGARSPRSRGRSKRAPTERERLRALRLLAATRRRRGRARSPTRTAGSGASDAPGARSAATRGCAIRRSLEQFGDADDVRRHRARAVRRLLVRVALRAHHRSPKTIDAEVDPMLRGSVAHRALLQVLLGAAEGARLRPRRRPRTSSRQSASCAGASTTRCAAVSGSSSPTCRRRSSTRACGATSRASSATSRRRRCASCRAGSRSSFGSERSAPELQRGLHLGDGLHLSGKIDRIDVDPFSARGIVQDYKSGKHRALGEADRRGAQAPDPALHARAARPRRASSRSAASTARSPARASTRGLLREGDARRPAGLRSATTTSTRTSSGRSSRRARERAHGSAQRIRARRRAPRSEGRRLPDVVRPLDDVPDRAPVNRPSSAPRSRRRARSSSRPVPGPARRPCSSSGSCARCATRARRRLGARHHLHAQGGRRAARRASAPRLRARGRHDLARELDGAWISTIHGFCSRLLRAHPFAVGLDPRFRELDDEQAPSSAARPSSARWPRSARRATPSGCGCSRRTARTGCGGCSPASTRRCARPAASSSLELGEQHGVGGAARRAARRGALPRRRPERDREAARRRERRARADGANPEQLLDLSALAPRGERAVDFEDARKRLEQAALDELARARPGSAPGAARPLRRRVRSGEAARVGARLRGSPAACARDLLRDDAAVREARAAALPRDHGRRVPGHEPAAVRASSTCCAPAPVEPDVFFVGDEFQSIYGFRHADVARLPRAARAGRTASAADAELPLAARGARRGQPCCSASDFGDELPAARGVG